MKLQRRSPEFPDTTRGFTLVEIITVIVLLGIFTAIGVGLMRDTAVTGRTRILQRNASELNNIVHKLRAAGTVFASSSTVGVTNGSASAPARVALRSTYNTTSVNAFVNQLEAGGITSHGVTAVLGRLINNGSYRYTWTNGVPVFSVVSNATVP